MQLSCEIAVSPNLEIAGRLDETVLRAGREIRREYRARIRETQQELKSKTQIVESGRFLKGETFSKGGMMRTKEKVAGGLDPARVALLFGLSLGLGTVVHEGFFILAGAIAVGAAAAAIANAIRDHEERSGLTPQHR